MDKDHVKITPKRWCVFVATWALLSVLCLYVTLHGDKFIYVYNDSVLFTFYLVPFLFLGALYGYFLSIITFTACFIVSLFTSMSTAYNMSIYLVAIMCFSMFSMYMFFRTIKGTVVAAAGTLILTAVTEHLCLALIQAGDYSWDKIGQLGDFIMRDTPGTICTTIAIFILFNVIPDKFKGFCPMGLGYTKAFLWNKALQWNLRKTKLSVKITAIIISLELFMGIAVAVYMFVLFPDLKGMFAEGIQRRDRMMQEEMIENENDQELSREDKTNDLISEINNLDYRFDSAAVSFDLKMILLMLCIGVPMAGFTNYFTKITIGAPIGEMSDFMYEYAGASDDEKLKVGKKVDNIIVNSHDEIKVLHESMKTTVHSIEAYIGRLKEEQELEKELEVANKASEAKSAFLSNMSHEIRTPINAVLGMNEMILRESSEPQIIEYANDVKSAGNSLLGIINDILDFSKIEAGKMDILPVKYHLGSTINDLVNMVAIKAENKGLKLELDIDQELPSELIGDEIRIKQCVTNILTNAVKYTEEGSVTLGVSFRKIDDEEIMLRFRVIDTGIGIKEEDINKLYSPFERIEEIRNRSIEGTGLGMSIVKKLLALMDARLEVKSVYGQGSDFSFEVKQQVGSWERLGCFKEKYREYLQSLDKYHEKFRAPDALILVVDDTPINLTVVKGLLKSTQIQVDTAESGKEAIEKVREKKYDAIFIDHRMPEMDGVETLAVLKKMDDNLSKDAPCVALTANAGAGARDDYMAAGFDDYLSKPVNGELMEDMLKELLPPEKLIVLSEEENDAEGGLGKSDGSGTVDILEHLEGVDYDEALKNCGSREVLETVIKDFALSIRSKADDIERFAEEKDYRNYTVAVHALKSSARLIGAMKLSGDAAYLEKCGDDGNEAEIMEKTPELLLLYRSYLDKLAPAVATADESGLPEISEEELKSAFSDMKELIEAYDFDTADGIMNMLTEYRIPDGYKEKYDKVRELMAAVDRDTLLTIL